MIKFFLIVNNIVFWVLLIKAIAFSNLFIGLAVLIVCPIIHWTLYIIDLYRCDKKFEPIKNKELKAELSKYAPESYKSSMGMDLLGAASPKFLDGLFEARERAAEKLANLKNPTPNEIREVQYEIDYAQLRLDLECAKMYCAVPDHEKFLEEFAHRNYQEPEFDPKFPLLMMDEEPPKPIANPDYEVLANGSIIRISDGRVLFGPNGCVIS